MTQSTSEVPALGMPSDNEYEDPRVILTSSEHPAITHLCSYASSHTERSTTKTRPQREEKEAR